MCVYIHVFFSLFDFNYIISFFDILIKTINKLNNRIILIFYYMFSNNVGKKQERKRERERGRHIKRKKRRRVYNKIKQQIEYITRANSLKRFK